MEGIDEVLADQVAFKALQELHTLKYAYKETIRGACENVLKYYAPGHVNEETLNLAVCKTTAGYEEMCKMRRF